MIEPGTVQAEAQTDLFSVNNGRGALISADEQYRYRLWRLWDAERPVMVWVLLNPSTADGSSDDPTVRKCAGFARRHHCGGIIIVNLFAWRSTDPKELARAVDPVGPDNDDHILWACRAPLLARVIGGWGANRFARRRAVHVRTLIHGAGRRIECFRQSDGTPWHPLYLPYASPLTPLEAASHV